MGSQLPPAVLTLIATVAGVYICFSAGGSAAGVLALLAAGFALGLWLASRSGVVDTSGLRQAANAGLLALPAILVLFFSFSAGGFFPDAQALAVIFLALTLAIRVGVARDPFEGFSWPLAVATGALALYAAWILLSGSWSDAPARALIEFERALGYLLVLVLLGSTLRTTARLRWMVRLLAAAIVIVAVTGFLTRVLPETFPVGPSVANKRLSYPLSYWNALGLLGTVGTVLCLHITSSLREPLAVRALSAAALPLLGATVLFTFSRGAIAAAFVGLGAYAILGRPRGLVTALVATVPATVLAVVSAYDATLLATDKFRTPAAVTQGHKVILAVGLCAAGAAAIRLLLALLDTRLAQLRLPKHLRFRVAILSWTTFAFVVVGAAVAVNAPQRVSSNYERFAHAKPINRSKAVRTRLVDPSSNGRVDHWKVAMRGYRRSPLRGQGAGTYGLLWSAERPAALGGFSVLDGHSIYVETLDELGIVGFILVVSSILALLASFLPVGRGFSRSLYAALFAAGLTWAIHAGVDWDWEMPAATIWVFALGGGALASRKHRTLAAPPPHSVRLLVGVLLLTAVLPASLILTSERQLDAARAAYRKGDCDRVISKATASIRTLAIRPEPYEAIAYCQVRRGEPRHGVAAMKKAIEHDPHNWEFRYGLALVQGAAGVDPTAEARRAKRMNPHDPATRQLTFILRLASPALRKRLLTRLAENTSLSLVL